MDGSLEFARLQRLPRPTCGITDALLSKFQTDFAVSNGFRFCPPLVPTEGGQAVITNAYLWSMLPVDSTIKSGVVTGQQIRDWLYLTRHSPVAPVVEGRAVATDAPWTLLSQVEGTSYRFR